MALVILITYIVVILPIMMLRRMYLKLYLKLQLGFLFGIVAINLATNVLRTVFTINRDLKQFSHLNASWVFFQITTAVIICSLPCYGSLLTYKKKNPTQLVGTPASGSKFSKGSGSLKTADSQDSIYKHTKVETTAIC